MAFNIDELLQKLEDSVGNKPTGPSKPGNPQTLQEQADALRVSMGNYTSPPKIKVGDFVRYRDECQPYIRHHDRLSIVVELIDPPMRPPLEQEDMGNCITYRSYDCVIATTDHTKVGGVLKYMADSRDLEIFPDADKLKSQHS